MNIKDFTWVKKRFGTHFAKIIKGISNEAGESVDKQFVPTVNNEVTFEDKQGGIHTIVTTDSLLDKDSETQGSLIQVVNSILDDRSVVKTIWQELKDLRDNSQLIPGTLYRITDYQCTTTQEDTQSAGHQFDIVLLALSADKLAEEGWAMMHDNDVYDVTFGVDNVTYKCYVYSFDNDGDLTYNFVDTTTLLGTEVIPGEGDIIINEETKTIMLPHNRGTHIIGGGTSLDNPNLIYNYFQNSNLSAWKVWYCLDNDTARFTWADDSLDESSPASISTEGKEGVCIYTRKQTDDIVVSDIQYYAWEGDENYRHPVIYTTSETPEVGDGTRYYDNGVMQIDESVTSFTPAHEGTGLPNGRGVIYRLIDEFNNDVAYDFKNIQFKTKLDSDGFYNINGDDFWTYSLNCYDVDNSICYDASIICATLVVSDMTLDCYDNFISRAMGDRKFVLQYNQIFTNYSFDDEITNSAYCIKMFKSANARIGFSSNVGVYGCSLFNMKYEGGAIYINNKKVLTEE